MNEIEIMQQLLGNIAAAAGHLDEQYRSLQQQDPGRQAAHRHRIGHPGHPGHPGNDHGLRLVLGAPMSSIPVPIDADDLANRFTYHPPQAGQPQLYEEIRKRALDYAQYLVQVCPPGRDTSLAITALEDVVFRANAAVARATPRDELLGLPKSSDFPPIPSTERMPGRFAEPPRTDVPLRTGTTLGPPAAGTGG